MLVIILAWPGWLEILLSFIAFIVLVVLGIRLSKWLFKKFLPEFFHEGERKWDDKK